MVTREIDADVLLSANPCNADNSYMDNVMTDSLIEKIKERCDLSEKDPWVYLDDVEEIIREHVPEPVSSVQQPDDSRDTLNHEEALELAHFKRKESNLARCYIELSSGLSSIKQESSLRSISEDEAVEIMAQAVAVNLRQYLGIEPDNDFVPQQVYAECRTAYRALLSKIEVQEAK